MVDGVKADGGGMRFNEGKNRLELLPIEWIWGLGTVMSRGAMKYAERNWERGMKHSIMVGCALRHLYKFVGGERYDSESGCHHLAAAAWNLLALMSYDLRGVGTNDLVDQFKVAESTAKEMSPEMVAAIQKAKEAKAPEQQGVIGIPGSTVVFIPSPNLGGVTAAPVPPVMWPPSQPYIGDPPEDQKAVITYENQGIVGSGG